MGVMFVARLICSDEGCAAEVAAESATLAELETLACECGCGLAIVGFPDWVEEPAVVALRRRPPPRELRSAA